MSEQKQEPAKYTLTERAYIGDTLLEPGAVIEYEGIPGHHMEALNAPAHAMKKKYPGQYLDPIIALTVVA